MGGGNEQPPRVGAPNGLEVNPRGQGPRAEADAARRLPHVSRAVRAACRRPSTAERAGSAGGPKPGRAGFYLELARAVPGAAAVVMLRKLKVNAQHSGHCAPKGDR